MRPRLGQHLIDAGLITEAQLDEALRIQVDTLRPLGAILQERGWLDPADAARALADQLELQYDDLRATVPTRAALDALDRELAESLMVLPLYWIGSTLSVAMADPLALEVLEELELQTGSTVQPVVAEARPLADAIVHHYAALGERNAALASARTALRAAAEDLGTAGHTPRLIVCSAGSPDIGLSQLAGSICAVAARDGQRVVVVDAAHHPSRALRPSSWSDDLPSANLVATDLATSAADPVMNPAGFAYVGGATGGPLRAAGPEERVRFAANLVHLGAQYDVLVCDLGASPLDDAHALLWGADVPIIVTSAQDIVRGYELIRDTCTLPQDTGTPAAAWEVGIAVSLVDTPAIGRTVFDHLAEAVEEHVRIGPNRSARPRLGLFGTIPCDRDTAAAAEAAGRPVTAAAPDSALGQAATEAATVAVQRLTRTTPEPYPLAGVVRFACGGGPAS